MDIDNISTAWKKLKTVLPSSDSTAETGTGTPPEQYTDLVDYLNRTSVVSRLSNLLLAPYFGEPPPSIQFTTQPAPGWTTVYDSTAKVLSVNPVGVENFCRQCRQASNSLRSPEARRSFQHYRYRAFLAELGKMPCPYLFCILILQWVADNLRNSTARTKQGKEETPDDREYMHLLWAFKQFECIYGELTGVSLRSEFRIHWYEAEWTPGR